MNMQKHELYQLVREDLLAGKYPEDEALPSGRQLAATYGANKDCANGVLAALEAEGLVRRDAGKRYSVRRHRSEERVIAIEHVSYRGSHPFSAGFNEGILDCLLSLQYGVQYFTHYDGSGRSGICQAPAISSLLERNILKGVIFPHMNRPSIKDLQVFHDRNVAVTVLGRERQLGAIVLDVEQAALRATHHLLSLGFNPVGIVCTRAFRFGREADIRGYRQALALEGMSDQEHIINCFEGEDDVNVRSEPQSEPFDITMNPRYDRFVKGAFDAVSNQIREGKLPRGLYIADEFFAIGAMRAIRQAGLRVPDDVAVVSHQSSSNWSFELSGITAMRFDAYACGVRAGHFIVEVAEGKRSPDDQLLIEASLVKGASCGEQHADTSSGLPGWMPIDAGK